MGLIECTRLTSPDTLNTVAQGSAPDADKQDAALASTYAFYQWSLLDSASNDAKSASEHLVMAKANRDLVTPPPTGLPPALAIAPAKPAVPGGSMPAMTPPG